MLSNKINVDIYDVLGKQVLNRTYPANGSTNKRIDTSSFQSGIYIVRVGDGTSFTTKKLVIQ